MKMRFEYNDLYMVFKRYSVPKMVMKNQQILNKSQGKVREFHLENLVQTLLLQLLNLVTNC